MNYFELSLSTRIYFGDNETFKALEKEKATIGIKTLIVSTGRSLRRLGYLNNLEKILKDLIGEDNVFTFENISANPDTSEIDKAVELGKKNGVTSVIGFGGGSAIDAAKAAAVGIASQNHSVEEYLLQGLIPPTNTVPIIAIPTTAGTGSELSKGAIVSCREQNVKSGIRGEQVIPVVAIVDPVYTWSLPHKVTMESGFDVFAHAVESYCSTKSNQFSNMLSEKAIKIVSSALRKLNKNLDDHDSRREMSFASNIMGFNLKNVGNCLPHRMQYPIGIITDTSHGAGLIALYPSWIMHEFDVNSRKINEIISWLGFNKAVTKEEVREDIISFMTEIGIRYTLSDLGLNESSERLSSMVTGNLTTDKLAEIPEIVQIIYKESK